MKVFLSSEEVEFWKMFKVCGEDGKPFCLRIVRLYGSGVVGRV